MIYEGFKNAIIDFISRADEIPNLIAAILYGSTLTGDISKKSDIDIMLVFDCDHNPELGEESRVTHKISSEIAAKYDLIHSFSFVIINQRKIGEVEADFLWNIIKEGIVIWGKPELVLAKEPHPSLQPMVLISYSIKNLSNSEKRTLLRRLYSSYGKIELINKKKERLGPGTILVNAKKFDEIKKVFDRFNVRYLVKKLWMH